MSANPLNLRAVAWLAVDARGNESLHRDHTAANNYITKPYLHGTVCALVKLSDVEALIEAMFNDEGQP